MQVRILPSSFAEVAQWNLKANKKEGALQKGLPEPRSESTERPRGRGNKGCNPLFLIGIY
jgi:hypothetical protein